MRKDQKERLSNNIYILAFGVFFLQVTFSAVAWLLVPAENRNLILAEAIASLILALSLIYLNNRHQRAFVAHIIFSLMFGIVALPLLQLGIIPIWVKNSNNFLLLGILAISFCIDWTISFYFYRAKFDLIGKENKESGRIDIKNGYWDLNEPLVMNESKLNSKDWQKIGWVVIPLSIGLTTFLQRNFDLQLLSLSNLAFLMAFSIIVASGLHGAIASKLIELEKNLHKNIILHGS